MTVLTAQKLLFEASDWNYDTLRRIYDAIEDVALNELHLDVYPNQIEVITSEQMLDAYASIGMPLMYRHWSFGKRFATEETRYRRGMQGLAYEMVINANPCISYVMEENSATMQALVIAHAAFGHNHFFKNNYLFRQWTDADTVLDDLSYAKSFVAKCEEEHGVEAVEEILDAAHALMHHGVHRSSSKMRASAADYRKRQAERRAYESQSYNDIWRTVPNKTSSSESTLAAGDTKEAPSLEDREKLNLPQENLLYFLEQYAPKLADWQRELLHIVQQVAQYFYPQRQTKVMNEGAATFVHYEIMNRLFDRGLIGEGAMLEFIRSHSQVLYQPGFDSQRYSGLNPYTLGFTMMCDIQRICDDPSEEDAEWFPHIAGNGDGLGTLREAWADFRDESFILQYLSPRVIRDLRLFTLSDEAGAPKYVVKAIHDERGYRDVRRALARQYEIGTQDPDIQVVEVDLAGNRRLVLRHTVHDGILLDKIQCDEVLVYLARLWGYGVKLIEVDAVTDKVLKEHSAVPLPS
ncbi:MAG: SpoVR family protein [Hyphomicrobiales bacterium]|nr:SpoVR family protein [Hyphomicrobiales bacterium]